MSAVSLLGYIIEGVGRLPVKGAAFIRGKTHIFNVTRYAIRVNPTHSLYIIVHVELVT